LAFAPAFGGDLDLVADLRGLLARDVPLAFGIRVSSWVCHIGGPWPVSQLTKPAWRMWPDGSRLPGQGVRGSRAHL